MQTTVNEIQQDTDEWHQWRAQGIGGSDMPTLFMMNKYKKVEELLEEKQTGVSNFKPNYFSERGKYLEPFARDIYNESYGVNTAPSLAVHSKYSFIRSSLDGVCPDKRFILEIKSPKNKADLERAKLGGPPPPKYMAQVQSNILCADVDFAEYITYPGEDLIYAIRVWPCREWQREIVLRSRWFWSKVRNKTKITDKELSELGLSTINIEKNFRVLCDNPRTLQTKVAF